MDAMAKPENLAEGQTNPVKTNFKLRPRDIVSKYPVSAFPPGCSLSKPPPVVIHKVVKWVKAPAKKESTSTAQKRKADEMGSEQAVTTTMEDATKKKQKTCKTSVDTQPKKSKKEPAPKEHLSKTGGPTIGARKSKLAVVSSAKNRLTRKSLPKTDEKPIKTTGQALAKEKAEGTKKQKTTKTTLQASNEKKVEKKESSPAAKAPLMDRSANAATRASQQEPNMMKSSKPVRKQPTRHSSSKQLGAVPKFMNDPALAALLDDSDDE